MVPNGTKTADFDPDLMERILPKIIMSKFFQNIKTFFRGADLVSNVRGESMAAVSGGDPENVNGASAALRLAAVYRCVSVISQSVARLPLLHQIRRGGIFRTEEDDLAWLLQKAPNEWTSAYDHLKMAVQQTLLFGDAIIIPQYDTFRRPKRLVLARPGTAGPSTRLGVYQVNDPEQGISGEYLEDEVIRIKGPTLDGVTCLSVISFAARTMSIGATSDRNTLNNFANGGATMGIITNERGIPGYGELQSDALQAGVTRIENMMRRGARLLALGGKWEYIPFTMTASDMQFLESRKFTVREICRFFGVHPSFVFDDTSNNYKSAENANSAFLNDTLDPILKQIEMEMNRKLFPRNFSERVMFDREQIYSSDPTTRMDYIEKRVQTGTYSPNEARRELGMPPIEGGDTPVISANLRPINETQTSQADE